MGEKMKPFQMVSASQISVFDADLDPRTGCNRRWYLEKIAGVPAPKSAGQVVGGDLHVQIENYYLAGGEITSPILIPGMPYWPARSPTVECERWFSLDVPDWPDDRPKKLLSFQDVVDMPWGFGRFVGKPDILDPGVPLVVDFKNMRTFSYVPKAEVLPRLPAMISYARAALQKNEGASEVQIKYVVHKTEAPYKAREVGTTMTRAQVEQGFSGLVQIIGTMRKTALVENWQDVTPNWGACRGYGGCPYRDRCEAARRAPHAQDGLVWDDVLAQFADEDRVITVPDLGKIVHLWVTREDVPPAVTEKLTHVLHGSTDQLWEQTVLTYDESEPQIVPRPEAAQVDWFRELVRWQTAAKVPFDDELVTNTDGKPEFKIENTRRERYHDLIAYLTACKTPCEAEKCKADRFCHCTFKIKRGEAMNQTQIVRDKAQEHVQTEGGVGHAAPVKAGITIVYGTVYKATGPVVALSEFLVSVKNAVASENGFAHYQQAPFAKLRGDVIARGLTKIRALDKSAGLVLCVDGRDEVESEIARMLMPEALLVVGVRS